MLCYRTAVQKKKAKADRRQVYLHIILILGAILTLFPLALTFINSFKSIKDYQAGMWFPSIPFRLYNYGEAWTKILPYMGNTLLVVLIGCGGMLIISSLASYAIGKIRFAGSTICFYLVLGLMMLPGVLTLVPSSMIYKSLHLNNTIWALIFPTWSNGSLMSVFLFTTFFRGLPKELFEAAKIDGAGEFKQYYKIALPLSAPMIGTCAIAQIVSIWNDYLWPKTIQSDVSLYTIPAGILYEYQNYSNAPEQFAGYILAALPLFLLFVFANKSYIEGIVGSAIKM